MKRKACLHMQQPSNDPTTHSPDWITFRKSFTIFIIQVFYHQVGVTIMSRSKVSHHSTRDAQSTGDWRKEESSTSSYRLGTAHTLDDVCHQQKAIKTLQETVTLHRCYKAMTTYCTFRGKGLMVWRRDGWCNSEETDGGRIATEISAVCSVGCPYVPSRLVYHSGFI